MYNEQRFNYTYSARENNEVLEIRKKYIPREETKLERLKRLDRHVQNAGMLESLSAGVIGALIFGVAMCIGLSVLEASMVYAYTLGISGTLVMISAYPLYRIRHSLAKEKYSETIIKLADEISSKK